MRPVRSDEAGAGHDAGVFPSEDVWYTSESGMAAAVARAIWAGVGWTIVIALATYCPCLLSRAGPTTVTESPGRSLPRSTPSRPTRS